MSYQRPVLSLEDARKAMASMLEEALKAPDRPIAIAICDDQGELVAFARMDKCAPLPLAIARKKDLYGGADSERHEGLWRTSERHGPLGG